MPLESCMLVLDNSEYMRNGDYVPTRSQAQAQAVSTVFTAKTDANPESAVGLMTMAGKAPSLLVTPTNDIGKLLSALGKSQIGGTSDLLTAVQIAQLALKHRENKNQRQRVVAFVGSPIENDQESLVRLGKKLRKNNVLIDIVTFGEEGMGNDEKLEALIEAAGGGESHLVSIPPGPILLSDVIATSPVLFDPNSGIAPPGAEGFGEESFDPNMDPELAMALRMSMQEEEEGRQREQASSSTAPAQVPAPATDSESAPLISQESELEPEAVSATTAGAILPPTMTAPLKNALDSDVAMVPGDEAVEGDEDEDEELKKAIAMSEGKGEGAGAGDGGGVGGEDVVMAGEEEEEDDDDEEAAIRRAIAMSLEDEKEKK